MKRGRIQSLSPRRREVWREVLHKLSQSQTLRIEEERSREINTRPTYRLILKFKR
ncbi:hypothetical protein MC7420_5702 [Coleofasciculus chthonoplastes PCC 7420]|uniref:Uncharacterized protein n=1 Tax=Coleofasciculus chthonoplastes PCC 7420 TaxID=118168 RepID=B4VW00_9CYAN|nr:hypothetical protein MC7420_5702 [Coleofasciculus chthonoplastes PCC 7420]